MKVKRYFVCDECHVAVTVQNEESLKDNVTYHQGSISCYCTVCRTVTFHSEQGK